MSRYKFTIEFETNKEDALEVIGKIKDPIKFILDELGVNHIVPKLELLEDETTEGEE